MLRRDVPLLDSHYHNGRAYSHSPIDSVATEIQMNFRHLSARGLAGVLTAGLLVACTPDAGPDPSTTPVGSPSASASSSSPETAEEKKQREAFEAAEKAYRANFREVGRLAMAGGATAPSEILRRTSTGVYLDVQMQSLGYLVSERARASNGGELVWVRRGAYGADELTIVGCEDFRRAELITDTGQTLTPENSGKRVAEQTITVVRSESLWKLSDVESKQVDQCG